MVQRFTSCVWYSRPASLGEFSGEQVDIISIPRVRFVYLELFLPPSVLCNLDICFFCSGGWKCMVKALEDRVCGELLRSFCVFTVVLHRRKRLRELCGPPY